MLKKNITTLEDAVKQAESVKSVSFQSDQYSCRLNTELKTSPIPLLESNQTNFQMSNNLLTASIHKNYIRYYFCGYNKHPRSMCPTREPVAASVISWSLYPAVLI